VAKPTLNSLGTLLRDRRGNRGLREVAEEIDVSPATLSRVENGKLPDLKTFAKICRWLQLDPSEMLGCTTASVASNKPKQKVIYAHLRADSVQDPEIAQALADMIMAAQRMISDRILQ